MGESTESHTGLWFGAWFFESGPQPQTETIIEATSEAITGGVALKVRVAAGSVGRISYEHLGDAVGNLTFCIKASSNVSMRIFRQGSLGSQTFAANTSWGKIDLVMPSADWLMTFELESPAAEDSWYIIDRLGTEETFSTLDLSGATTGPDEDISSSELVFGGENLAGVLSPLENGEAIKIIALGDSVTMGAQISRGNGFEWTTQQEEAFIYSSVMARQLESNYALSKGSIDVINFGHGGETSQMALDNEYILNEIEPIATSNDLIFLEFGANDFTGGTSVVQWQANISALIDQLQAAQLNNIVVMGITAGEVIFPHTDEISAALEEIHLAKNVAVIDVTKLMYYRGEDFSWASLANTFHPDASGHATIGAVAATLLTKSAFNILGTPLEEINIDTPPNKKPFVRRADSTDSTDPTIRGRGCGANTQQLSLWSMMIAIVLLGWRRYGRAYP